VRAAVYISLVLLGSLALANLYAIADIAGASSGSVSRLLNTGAQIGGPVTASLTPWIASRLGWTASFWLGQPKPYRSENEFHAVKTMGSSMA
jgi:hypothetical protein